MPQPSDATDYRKTLNLPQTDFDMKAGLLQKEPAFLEKWAKDHLYESIKQSSQGRPTYILHDGPPYANGDIHIGHALNKILKDFIVKYKTMRGFNSYYLPGWDCHGLPIEHKLLETMNKKKSEVDCVEFRKKAHDYAMKFVGTQREQFKRLGIFGEWDHPYLTLDPEYEYWILKSLAALNKKGFVYRGLKPVNWCASCETALAEAEVEYDNHTSASAYVKFEVANLPKDLSGKKVSLLIWTTTPWTLLANVAVAVHSAFTYAFVQVGAEVLIIERSLVEKILGKGGVSEFKIIKEVLGSELTGFTYKHPFGVQTQCRVVTADYVTKDDGTGLVHTAPGHGQDDFETGVKYKLDVLVPVDNRGIYNEKAGKYAGQYVFKANAKIIADLKESSVLFASENITHSYPHCWRCKTPIIFRATKQWFLRIDHENLRGRLKDAIKRDVKWIPPAGEERILGMVAGRPDWCLSRQRFWGVPIPAVTPKGGDEPRLYPEVIEHFAEIVKREGTDAWFTRDIKDLIPQGFVCPHTKATEFEKTFDILDVWFDSGVSHQAVVKARLKMELPIDMYLEGSDQHRGWFQSSLIPAMAIEGKPPFREVLTHGFVVDGQGRKMSKSLGNVISPQDIIKNNGADILRLWVASSSYNEDIRISKEVVDRLVDAYRKIRNTIRYLLGNLYDFNPDKNLIAYSNMPDLDKWALSRLAHVMGEVTDHFEQYEFARVFKSIYTFCNEDLSNFYLDILKDRLYISSTKSPERRSAQSVLYHILNSLVRSLAPLITFTAEEIFMKMPKSATTAQVQSVHLLSWSDIPAEWSNTSIDDKFEPLLALRGHVMKALEEERRVGAIGSSLEAKITFETASERDYKYLKDLEFILPDMFIVSQVVLKQVGQVNQGLDERFSKTAIHIDHADGKKCSRSWKYTTDVGSDPDHPTLSLRCAQIVKEMQNAD